MEGGGGDMKGREKKKYTHSRDETRWEKKFFSSKLVPQYGLSEGGGWQLTPRRRDGSTFTVVVVVKSGLDTLSFLLWHAKISNFSGISLCNCVTRINSGLVD